MRESIEQEKKIYQKLTATTQSRLKVVEGDVKRRRMVDGVYVLLTTI